MSDETAPTHETPGSTRTADASDMQTAKDWFKSVFKIQHAAIVEAQAERRQAAEDRRQALEDRRTDRQLLMSAHQANAARISRLEDLLLAMNIKNETDVRPVQPAPGRVDLQKFRTSDGPIYRGPFQETEPFLRWIHGVQIFFDTKDVNNAADRLGSPSGPSSTPGKPTQPPAGRPSTRAASVAGVTDVTPLEAQVSALQLDAAMREDSRWDTYFDDEGCYPSMEPAAVAALEDLDRQLLANEIEQAEQANLADAIAGHPGRA
ncbi:uncharacterized protein PGTG_15222 [Puccinia graminis f. sp. tritici CRL 75-36-700-3]|uniref:Uncharacterized protein n=1 Tax=Puccinia graminis f. sp. tritici (strain CRL 75-36-700-3 / race SCCL) TaxID=418459 RepID=E3KXE6_PUCGT|nr:uncharacterized protein PGTG_15222 [Puccinia graminis f. sp. tritici CRL 75-36-700-3]EFP89019.1 hypothetical protein PGTG_15222 [Puccinia graminis f. sp. tritici CRL 75-36-700-3]